MSEPVINVVLIEDDPAIRRFVKSALEVSGFQVWPAENAIPILILSARGEEMQKVAALGADADDYLTKPFGVPVKPCI
jgi:two-component system KDP operon response regulator KdpE